MIILLRCIVTWRLNLSSFRVTSLMPLNTRIHEVMLTYWTMWPSAAFGVVIVMYGMDFSRCWENTNIMFQNLCHLFKILLRLYKNLLMVIKAMIMHLPGCKIRSNSEYYIMHSSRTLWSDRRIHVACTWQCKVRTVNFLKCYVSNSCMPPFLP